MGPLEIGGPFAYGRTMAQLLHAVAFGKAGTDGNDGFSAEQYNIPTTDEVTYEELLVEWKKCVCQENDATTYEEVADLDDPDGFWLLTAEHLSIAHLPFDGGMGSDAAFIQANKTSKRICQRLSVKNVYKSITLVL
jgi:hypothetical protein